MLPDRWNLRLWLRDWLTKPSRAEAGSGQSLPNRMLIDATTFGSVNAEDRVDAECVAPFRRSADGRVSISPVEPLCASVKECPDTPPAPSGSAEHPGPDRDPRST